MQTAPGMFPVPPFLPHRILPASCRCKDVEKKRGPAGFTDAAGYITRGEKHRRPWKRSLLTREARGNIQKNNKSGTIPLNNLNGCRGAPDCREGSRVRSMVMIVPAGKDNRELYLKGALLVLIIAILFTGLCSPAAADRDVRVALTDLKPTLYTDDTGKPAGFFVDIINDVAARQGWNVTWVRGSLAESWDRLKSGEIDLLPGVASTPERQSLYDFSNESALAVWSQVYARPGSGISTILDLDGKRVASVKGAQSGIGFRDYAQKFGVNITLIEKDTPAAMFSATASGEADALVVYNTAAQADARTYGLAATPVMFNPTQFGFAVPKGKNHDLIAPLDQYVAEGKADPSSTYSRAMQTWFGVQANPVIPSWIAWGLAGAACVALLFVGMSLILRREVRRKTTELSRRNEELQSEIAHRKRAEDELADEMSRREVLIDQSRDGIVILDQEGRVYDTNRKFAEMLGYSREEMQQLHVWDWDVQFDREQLQEMIRTIDAEGAFFASRHRRKDGSIIDVEISTNAAVFSREKLIFCVTRDTSERKKAEEQLRTMNASLQTEVASRMRAEQELRKSEQALLQARKKLNLLNTLTFQDIQSGIFTLASYLQIAETAGCSDAARASLEKGEAVLHSVGKSLDLAKKYQGLGMNPPRWQNVNMVLLNALSHIDYSGITRIGSFDTLEIFADPLLEDAFRTIMEYLLVLGGGKTAVRFEYREVDDRIILVIEDTGPGIPVPEKEGIFTRESAGTDRASLFLVREILSITGMTIRETGTPGTGTRFEITVPKEEYRFRDN